VKILVKIKSKEQLLEEGYYENPRGDLICSGGARLTIHSDIGNKIYGKVIYLKKANNGWTTPPEMRKYYVDPRIIEKKFDPEQNPEYFL
jgi:hypothetical protein